MAISLTKGLLSTSSTTLRITLSLGKQRNLYYHKSDFFKIFFLSLEYVPENLSEVAKIGQILASIQTVSRKESVLNKSN